MSKSNVKHQFAIHQHVISHQIGPMDGKTGVITALTSTRDTYPMATVQLDLLVDRHGQPICMDFMESSLTKLEYRPAPDVVTRAEAWLTANPDWKATPSTPEWVEITPEWHLYLGDSSLDFGPALYEVQGKSYTENFWPVEPKSQVV